MVKIIFLVVTIVFMPGRIFGQDFNKLTSKIFFNSDITKTDTSLISDFKSKQELILQEDTGWTVYGPADKQGNSIRWIRFSFSSHPYFLSEFKSGGIMIIANNDFKKVIGLSLSISFESKDVFDSIYQTLQKSFARYSSKKIKRPNIAKPFEVTKFVSKANNDFVIITKGETSNKPYIHISYNFQDYEW